MAEEFRRRRVVRELNPELRGEKKLEEKNTMIEQTINRITSFRANIVGRHQGGEEDRDPVLPAAVRQVYSRRQIREQDQAEEPHRRPEHLEVKRGAEINTWHVGTSH